MQKAVATFEKRMGWGKTEACQIIRFIKKDAKELNARNAHHKTIDILFGCM